MVQRHEIRGYQQFQNFVKNLSDDKLVSFYFSGNKDPAGRNWCLACFIVEPYVYSLSDKAPEDSLFVHVEVGTKEEFRAKDNGFRTDTNIHLTCLPTLLRWKTPFRLEGLECKKVDLLDMFFSDIL